MGELASITELIANENSLGQVLFKKIKQGQYLDICLNSYLFNYMNIEETTTTKYSQNRENKNSHPAAVRNQPVTEESERTFS